jgi:transcriptional regulator with XRE-family HTH domain
MQVHELLKEIRNHGLTQVQVAERSGLPQSTISKLERGEVADVMSRSYLSLLALYNELQQKVSV